MNRNYLKSRSSSVPKSGSSNRKGRETGRRFGCDPVWRYDGPGYGRQCTEAKEGLDFFPLTVEYRESSYAAGRIRELFRREGRPTRKKFSHAV